MGTFDSSRGTMMRWFESGLPGARAFSDVAHGALERLRVVSEGADGAVPGAVGVGRVGTAGRGGGARGTGA